MQTTEKRDVRGNVIPSRRSTVSNQKTIIMDRDTEDEQVNVIVKYQRHGHWLLPVGVTMLVGTLLILLYSQVVLPRWIRYQDQLACGAGHICRTEVVVSPGQEPRTFVSLIYNQRLTVIETGKPDGSDSHVYIGPFLALTNWQEVTPHLQMLDVNNDGFADIVISSPDFQGASYVLYNQGDGSFDFKAPQRKDA